MTAPPMSRTEMREYFDHDPTWVIGQIDRVTSAGQEITKNHYYPTSLLPETVKSFGIVQKRMTYHPDGTLASLTQGKQTTKYTSYMRGVPQKVEYVGTSITEASQINNLGNPNCTRDAAGHVTSYGYDAMGRLARVTYPSGDTTAWNVTTISFTRSPEQKYDLPPGHWKYLVKTGNGYVANYYDALWRPVYSEQWDAGNVAGTMRITKRMFDSGGRTTYESYPKRTHAQIGDGVHHQFDALGREVLTSTSSELGMLYTGYEYRDGFVKVKIDNRGHGTAYSYQAFDQPTEDALLGIWAPEGVKVTIERDIFNKPLSITRSGNGKTATRKYVYDSGARLCKTIEPEIGATIQQYDVYNNLEWKATGLTGSTFASTSLCNQTSVPAARKTTFKYDVMNLLSDMIYGDGSPAVKRTYTPDGLPETVDSNGAIWTYQYNKRRLNTLESLKYAGVLYDISRKYDPNGSLKSITYPVDKQEVDYAPNALGEPTRAGAFASNVTYHPNGAIAGFTYGNGIVHSMEQNVRGLPWRSVDAGILSDTYSYDQNANVKSIIDGMPGGVTNRVMEYDALDRLTTVSAPNLWGKATYKYDSLDNLTYTDITAGQTRRTSTHNFDAVTNRLSSISSNVSAYNLGFGYDAQGNISKRGTQEFVFDMANRMKSAKGKGTYTYDGHGRRVSVVGTDGVNRIQVYGNDGKLRYAGVTGITGSKYIYLGNHLIAEIRPGFTQYDHTDGLGSPVALTNSARSVFSRTRYEPYGATAAGDSPAIGFTGHVNAADIGLVYMQQRYYDPSAGRFLSVDPVTTGANTASSFNRYAYANNNPYKNIDPDGRNPMAARLLYTAAYRAATWAGAGTLGSLIGIGIYDALHSDSNSDSSTPTSTQPTSGSAPPAPGTLVGEQGDKSGPTKNGKRHASGPLTPGNGGTGDANKDFDKLTGGTGKPPDSSDSRSSIPGVQVGDNGVWIRPDGKDGPRIEIPSAPGKLPETLHYPPETK